MRALLAGNWKMQGLRSSLAEIATVGRSLTEQASGADVLICPPASLVREAAAAAGTALAIGGQDCHPMPSGAFTGDISAEMLKDAGASAVILGHSERRQFHGESDALVAAKVNGARRAGLTAIVCVGESEDERNAERALTVVGTQLRGSIPAEARGGDIVVAYEPVWAIGTGRTPTSAQIAEMHGFIRAFLNTRFGPEGAAVRILYGGSVKPANAGEILTLPDVNGALVGGASLKAADFLAIIRAAPAQR